MACSMGTIEDDGRVNIGPLVKIDTSAGVPTELCWASVSSDDKMVYATNFGYSNVSSYRINGHGLEIASDPACPKVPGDGTARGLNGTVTSGPADSWLSPDDAYLYQIYGNAAKLVCYATQPDGSLKEVGQREDSLQQSAGSGGVLISAIARASGARPASGVVAPLFSAARALLPGSDG